MTDPHAEQPNTRRLDCEDCQAGPDSGDIRTLAIGTAGTTETWHIRECPAYTIQQILGEAGAQKVKEQQARAEEAFLAA
ncbi:hypothetical protein ACIG5E_38195 [Kitasatospora sp. NPDC053057]|uniref:hypothetical protein n=1 Tax=Kitasatospora sp. NPDC053057 TaxID=3364062 RepID=UPI0037C99D9F